MRNPPLVVHLVYALDFGGLETLLVECINRMREDRFRHAVVCLTHYTDFRNKIIRPGVEVFALRKEPGLGVGTHARFRKLMRLLKPAVLHTYNLSALEYAFTARLAGVPACVHAEHGRDASDPEGKNRKHRLLRRLIDPFVDCYVPVSRDLAHWLATYIGVPQRKIRRIENGVDTDRFHCVRLEDAGAGASCGMPDGFADGLVVGAVGRVQDVKNHAGLIDAFILARKLVPQDAVRLRLAIVGDGPLLPELRGKIAAAGLGEQVWLAGARNDIAGLMPRFSVFALASIAEGTPVTVLEAMACGLPVVATRVGGVPDAVIDGTTGKLVPANDAEAMANALAEYALSPALRRQHGAAGRLRAEQEYSLSAMLKGYEDLYEEACGSPMTLRKATEPCAE